MRRAFLALAVIPALTGRVWAQKPGKPPAPGWPEDPAGFAGVFVKLFTGRLSAFQQPLNDPANITLNQATRTESNRRITARLRQVGRANLPHLIQRR